ncbi:MAG: 3-dehydroquinate synthase [Bacteriovoracaceae bacterium]|nr:3-dehydroquinate synthase [Bacteriovoracaceae bacterium]
MKTIKVDHPQSPYSVVVGRGICQKIPKLLGKIHGRGSKPLIVVFTDRKLGKKANAIHNSLIDHGYYCEQISITASEKFKSFDSIYPLYGKLLKFGADRSTILIAIGGGVIGDSIGFLASTFMRGIKWVGVPTTVLSQVDSSIGGKTGINHQQGKNLIGSFHPPALVVTDTIFLNTLPKKEIKSGMGEVIKYGLIVNKSFFKKLKSQKKLDWEKTIHTCVKIKADIVSKDEKDRSGLRELLNFGHTFAHGIETHTKYKKFSHGEAVMWGMIFAAKLSYQRGRIQKKEYLEISTFINSFKLKPLPVDWNFQSLYKILLKDKKNKDGIVHFVLLEGIGVSSSANPMTKTELKRVFESLTKS